MSFGNWPLQGFVGCRVSEINHPEMVWLSALIFARNTQSFKINFEVD